MKRNRLAILSLIVCIAVFGLTTIFDIQIPFLTNKGALTEVDKKLSDHSKTLAVVTEKPVIQSFAYDTDASENTDYAGDNNNEDTDSTYDVMVTGDDLLDDTNSAVDSEATPTPEAEATKAPEKKSKYADIGIAIADDYVNIRDKASTDSSVLGKLYKGSACKIKKTKDDWYYVSSGDVKGYVKAEYIKTSLSDEELIKKYGTLSVSVECDGLNVRTEPSMDAKKVTVVYKDEVYPVIKEKGVWLKVKIPDEHATGYVKSEFTNLIVEFKVAISKEEEEKLKQLEEDKKAKEKTEVKHQDSVDYNYSELQLLACLIHAEAGSQNYETKLAVANIVLNRMDSSIYPDSMKAVIYQSGQFTVAASGSLQKQLSNYHHYSNSTQLLSIKAAKDALAGSNNIGSRMHFNSYRTAINHGKDHNENAVKLGGLLFW